MGDGHGQEFPQIKANGVPAFGSLAFAPDSKTLVTADASGWIRRYDAADGKLLKEWRGAIYPLGATISPDGKTLATATMEGVIALWDLSTGKEKVPVMGHNQALLGVALTADGKGAFTISQDNSCRAWDAASKERWCMEHLNVRYTSAAFSPDGRWLAARKRDNSVGLYDLATGKEERSLPSPAPTPWPGPCASVRTTRSWPSCITMARCGSGTRRLARRRRNSP